MRAAPFAFAIVFCAAAPARGTEVVAKSGETHSPGAIVVEAVKPSEPSAKPREIQVRPPHGRSCLTQSEAREKIVTRRLSDPIHALRLGRQQGEALRVKLCRWKPDEFVYEIFVLKRDGRLVRVYMNAENGQVVSALGEAERK